MKRVLFVDDQPQVLQGLRARLRKKRKVWDMAFVESGELALEAAAVKPFDVIVTDLKMPVMDGAALLERLQAEHPSTVRLVLSGYAEIETSLRAIPLAHQFLSKPCEGTRLEDAIARALNVRDLVEDEATKRALGGLTELPAAPRIYTQLCDLLNQPFADLEEVAALIERDVAVSARVMQVVNSSFFALPQQIGRMAQAVAYLGIPVVKSLVLSIEVLKAFPTTRGPRGFAIEDFERRCWLTGNLAAEIYQGRDDSTDAFAAGLLHDIGLLVLLTRDRARFAPLLEESLADGAPLPDLERLGGGVSHATAGAYLLGIWGIPFPVVDAAAGHDAPNGKATQLDLRGAVHIAAALAEEVARGEQSHWATSPLDLNYVRQIGAEPLLAGWRDKAVEAAERQWEKADVA